MVLMLKSLYSNQFVKNVAILISGTAIAQALMLLSAPALSRLYTPAAFGVLGLFVSVAGIVSVISTLRYEMAIVLERDDKDAANVLILSLGVTMLMTIISLLIIAIFGGWIAHQLGEPALKAWLWLVPVSVLAIGVYQSLNFWATRQSLFKRLSISRVFNSVAVIVTQIGAGLNRSGVGGLIGGQVFGQAIATCILAYQTWKNDIKNILESANLESIRGFAIKHKEFPLYGSPQALLNSASQNIPSLLLAFFYSIEVVGFFSLSLRLLQAPINLISQSVSQVYYQKAAEVKHNAGDLAKLLTKSTIGLAVLGFGPALLIGLLGDYCFSLILGDKWLTAGKYSQWIIIWIFFMFINTPAVATAQIIKLQRMVLIYDIILLSLRMMVLVCGGMYLNPISTIVLYSLISAISNLTFICGVVYFTKRVHYSGK